MQQDKEDLILRLKKIEGQVRGIQKMITEERNCPEIMTQLIAVGRAIDKVSVAVASHSLKECITSSDSKGTDNAQVFDDTIAHLLNAAKRAK